MRSETSDGRPMKTQTIITMVMPIALRKNSVWKAVISAESSRPDTAMMQSVATQPSIHKAAL